LAIEVSEDLLGNFVELLVALRSDDSGKENALDVRDGSQSAVSLIVVSHQNVGLLELLEGETDDLAGAGSVVVLGVTVVLSDAENVSQRANTELGTQIDLSGQSGGSDVEPVLGIGSHVLGVASLDEVTVLNQLDLLGLLQVLGVGGDEGIGRDVLDGNAVASGSS